jgi:hypothetical protein
MRRFSLAVLALLAFGGTLPAKTADDLRHAEAALNRHDLDTATETSRRILQSDEATDPQRRHAMDLLLAAAVARGRPAELLDAIQALAADAPEERRPLFRTALARAQAAADGHLHGAVQHFTRQAKETDDREAARFADQLQGAARRIADDASRPADIFQQHARRLDPRRMDTPRPMKRPKVEHVTVSKPDAPAPQGKALRLSPPPRRRLSARVRPVAVPMPRPPRLKHTPPLRVVKRAAPPRSLKRLAARFYTQAYRRARELYADGLIENAKAEYATIIVLFPDTSYAFNAARYALRLFQRQFAAGQRAEMLVAYLRWVRSAAGEAGLDYAEYLAIQSYARRASAPVIAREAAAFVQRYPNSKYLTPIRLKLAVALEQTGEPEEAIQALAPLADQPFPAEEEETGETPKRPRRTKRSPAQLHAKALLVLAWLHVFQGRAGQARALLKRLAGQDRSPAESAAAQALLEQLARQEPDRDILPPPQVEQPLPLQLLAAADALRQQGRHEPAMDLYTLFLRVGRDIEDYSVHRDRIVRFKETGRMDE